MTCISAANYTPGWNLKCGRLRSQVSTSTLTTRNPPRCSHSQTKCMRPASQNIFCGGYTVWRQHRRGKWTSRRFSCTLSHIWSTCNVRVKPWVSRRVNEVEGSVEIREVVKNGDVDLVSGENEEDLSWRRGFLGQSEDGFGRQSMNAVAD